MTGLEKNWRPPYIEPAKINKHHSISDFKVSLQGNSLKSILKPDSMGGLPYEKDGGACWKEPYRGTKILFCRRGLKLF